MRNSVSTKICEFANKDKNVFLIVGDAGFGVWENYREQFPKRFLNMGVAEQNMISFAAGLGLSGYKVFVYNIIPFLLYRCYEQVRNDICYQRVPVTLLGIGSGVTYAPGGVTHYGVEDLLLARTLPNMEIMSPSDPLEAELCIEHAYKSKNPTYIRIPKSGEPVIHTNAPNDISRPIVVKKGKDVAILFHGSVSIEVVKATDGMEPSPMLISVPMIQPLDTSFLGEILSDTVHTLITVEENFKDGSLGGIISEWITKERCPYRLEKMGITNEFIHVIKNINGMREHYGFSSSDIRERIETCI
ncbi:MAG: hypothetical protein MRK01_02415 [Candidatus Scalindua sp.]|nr:hypothetical protein [Candidatus Scalindua sp.]